YFRDKFERPMAFEEVYLVIDNEMNFFQTDSLGVLFLVNNIKTIQSSLNSFYNFQIDLERESYNYDYVIQTTNSSISRCHWLFNKEVLKRNSIIVTYYLEQKRKFKRTTPKNDVSKVGWFIPRLFEYSTTKPSINLKSSSNF